MALKDLLDVAGVVTTNGMESLRGHVAAADAAVTERLKAAGAVLLGKLNMHEAAMGATNDNPHFGRCLNPWDHAHSPGGSSGGSGAAVAAGLCAGALGTDNMGSVRIPAAFCGVAGLKPSNGLVSTRGMHQLSWSTATIGPLCRGVGGVALLMAALAGHDPLCADSARPPRAPAFALPSRPSLRGLRLGVVTPYVEDSEPETRAAFAEALHVFTALGAEVAPVAIAGLEHARLQCLLIIEAEGAVALEDVLADPHARLGEDVRHQLVYGARMPSTKLVKALRFRTELRHRMTEVFARCDALLAPTTPVPAVTFAQGAPATLSAHMPLGNLCEMPALSLPMGFSAAGLPLGLQIMAAPFDDALTLRVGLAYEQATDWHLRLPA